MLCVRSVTGARQTDFYVLSSVGAAGCSNSAELQTKQSVWFVPLAHVGEAPEEPPDRAPSVLDTVSQSLKRGSRAQETEVAPLQEHENPPVTSSQAQRS